MTATAHDIGATLTVNGVAVSSGEETGEIPLVVCTNAIEVTCTAEDGIHSTTYAVTVTRSGAPVISLQPSSRTVTEGQRATFMVEAVGSGTLRYQWYVDRAGAKGWEAIDSPSARTPSYTTSKAQLKSNGYRYACLIENQAGSVRSDPVRLTVIEKSAPHWRRWQPPAAAYDDGALGTGASGALGRKARPEPALRGRMDVSGQ